MNTVLRRFFLSNSSILFPILSSIVFSGDRGGVLLACFEAVIIDASTKPLMP